MAVRMRADEGVALPVTTALVGREYELGTIGGFLERAAAEGDALLLTGAPGIGKTVLLDAAAEWATVTGLRVLRGSGVEFEAEIPFAGLHQVLLPLVPEFDRLATAHRDALTVALGFAPGPAPDRAVVGDATLALVRDISQARPLLIIVDDVHWLDGASARVLRFVAQGMTGTATGFLATARPDTDEPFTAAALPSLRVGPLDVDSATALIGSRFGDLAPHTERRLVAEGRGNPLALLELPRALPGVRQARLGVQTGPPLGRRLQDTYGPQLAELPERSRQALLMMALDGIGDAASLGGGDSDRPGRFDLAPARRAGLLEREPGSHRLTFCHPLIRAAVIELSTAEQRRRAHRQLAALMPDQPDRCAWHLAEGTIEPREEVAAMLEQAACGIAERGDGAAAVTALTRAADLSPAASDRARRLVATAHLVLKATGDLQASESLLLRARRADPSCAVSLESAIVTAYGMLHGDGDVVSAHRLLVAAMEAEHSEPVAAPTMQDGWRALVSVCQHAGRADLWQPVRGLLASREPPRRPLAANASLIEDPAGASSAALKRLADDIESLPRVTDSAEIVDIAVAAASVDRLHGCRATLRQVVDGEQSGAAIGQTIGAQNLLALDGYLAGDWDEADRRATAAGELAGACGHRLARATARIVSGLVAAARGETAAARQVADETIQWAAPRGVRKLQVAATYVRVLAALGNSDFEAAYRQATRISPAGRVDPGVPLAPWVMLDLVEAALRTERAAEAAMHVDAIHAAGVADVSPRWALLSGAAAGLVASDADAVRLFERALALDGVDRWPFDLARVHLLYGERLRRARGLTASRVHLSAALETFQRLGARPWAERAAQELRATGPTRPRGDDRDRDALTPQEIEIATLAAGGLSNKQIALRLCLSHRTVAGHLYRIFPKLGVASRAALRDALTHQPGGARHEPVFTAA
jgi:DNA-binding CsgD family transcriptional regulator